VGGGCSGSLCVFVTSGAWGWFKPPLPLGNKWVVSHLPGGFAKVSFAIWCAAQFLRKDCKYFFVYKKYLTLSMKGRKVINS